MKPTYLLIPLFPVLVVLTTGCACFNDTRLVSSRYTTVGQELVDLKKARDAGLINDVEYQQQRQKILKMNDLEIDAAMLGDKKNETVGNSRPGEAPAKTSP